MVQYLRSYHQGMSSGPQRKSRVIVSWSGLHLKYNAIFFYAGNIRECIMSIFCSLVTEDCNIFHSQSTVKTLESASQLPYRHMWRQLPYFPRALSKVERRMVNSRNVKVDFSLEDMDLSEFKGKATYEQIKTYVLEETGLKVSSLYIAQIKKKCGLDVGENFNLSKSDNARQPQCTPEKEDAIMQAFKHFGLI